MIYLLASLQIRHDPSVHADPGRIFLHLQKQMSYLWVSTAYGHAVAITNARLRRLTQAKLSRAQCNIILPRYAVRANEATANGPDTDTGTKEVHDVDVNELPSQDAQDVQVIEIDGGAGRRWRTHCARHP